MTIGVDCRLAGLKHAGIGRYIANLIIRFPDSDPRINWVYFFYDKEQAKEVLKDKQTNKNIKIIYIPIKHYTLKEQLLLPKKFLEHKLDLLYIPHFNIPIFYPKKIVITIHDLLWHEQRGKNVTTLNPSIYWLKYLSYHFITTIATIKAKQIIVPAQTVKNILIHYYKWTKNKISITKEGVDKKYLKLQEKDNLSKKTQTPSKTKQLIYTGSLYPHKNIQLIIKSLKKLPNHTLKIVGARNVFQEKTKKLVKKLNIEKQVVFAGYLSDHNLIKEYKKSQALVLPSFSEGFGLPGVEAMAIGLPVLASNIDIFKEIYQDAAIYFDPNSQKSFLKALDTLENTQEKTLIEKGLKLVKNYNWDRVTTKTIKTFEKAIHN